jgi:hypothetical protein
MKERKCIIIIKNLSKFLKIAFPDRGNPYMCLNVGERFKL